MYHQDYIQWKTIMDDMYAGRIRAEEAVYKWLNLLGEGNFKMRPGHALEGFSYFVYDKDWYADGKIEKPLGLGITYTKPGGGKTQDIIMVHPKNGIETYYKEVDMIKRYPAMRGVHKEKLPF